MEVNWQTFFATHQDMNAASLVHCHRTAVDILCAGRVAPAPRQMPSPIVKHKGVRIGTDCVIASGPFLVNELARFFCVHYPLANFVAEKRFRSLDKTFANWLVKMESRQWS